MNPAYKKAGASTIDADIERTSGGGFTAVVSNGDLDRDGERIAPGALELPASIPIHLDHTMSAATVVARGRPYYRGSELRVDATFGTTEDAQLVRRKVKDGILDSLSIVFLGKVWKDIDGVRTCVKGELLAADIVSVPSNRGARILTMRSFSSSAAEVAREAAADALLSLARVEIAEAKRYGAGGGGRHRRRTDAMLRTALTERDYRPKPGLHTPLPKETP